MKRISDKRNNLSERIHEEFLQLKFKKGLSCGDMIKQRDSLPEFWSLWESFNKKKMKVVEINSPEAEKYALKSLEQIGKNLFANSPAGRRRKDTAEKIKFSMSMGFKPLEAVNQVISEEIKTDIILDDNKNEVSRTSQKTIVAKKIERIEFASELTVNTIQNIMASQEISDEWLKDYKNAIDCSLTGKKYEGKYQFHHLETAGKFKKMVLDTMDRCQDVIVNGDFDEIKLAQARLRACSSALELLNGMKETELTPLRILSIAHEAGVNRQKEIAGAISNDRTMIDMGNIVIKDEKDVTDRRRIREKLKEQGFDIKLQDILTDTLKSLGGMDDINIQNPIIEAEFTEKDESE